MSGLEFVAAALLLAAVFVLVVAAIGLWKLPDTLARQHAGTKAVTLALATLAVGAALIAADREWTIRLIALLALLVATLPAASHALARAAVRENVPPQEIERAPRF